MSPTFLSFHLRKGPPFTDSLITFNLFVWFSSSLLPKNVHCIKSKLYLAKWKWILRSGPKLKMLVKFNCSNGSFLNPLDWQRIRFGCTALDQCYWNKENWFANWCVGWPRAWSAAGEILLQLILYVNAPPNIKQTICAYKEIRPHVTRILSCASDHWTTPALSYEVSGRD